MKELDPALRSAIYKIGIVIGGLLVVKGYITSDVSDALGALFAAFLAVADANVPKDEPR